MNLKHKTIESLFRNDQNEDTVLVDISKDLEDIFKTVETEFEYDKNYLFNTYGSLIIDSVPIPNDKSGNDWPRIYGIIGIVISGVEMMFQFYEAKKDQISRTIAGIFGANYTGGDIFKTTPTWDYDKFTKDMKTYKKRLDSYIKELKTEYGYK